MTASAISWTCKISFLVGALAFGLGCSGGSSTPAGAGVAYSGSCVGADVTVEHQFDHIHDVDVPDKDVRRGGNRTYSTTHDHGHTHEVSFSAMDLTLIGKGNVIHRVTDRGDDHTHPTVTGCVH